MFRSDGAGISKGVESSPDEARFRTEIGPQEGCLSVESGVGKICLSREREMFK